MCNEIKEAVILGAGERKFVDKPVGFLEIEDSTLIERLINILNANGIEKISIVTGYKKEYYEELSKKKNLTLIYNEKFKWTGTMHSLALAKDIVNQDFLLIESDIVFEERVISKLIDSKSNNTMLIASESGSGDEALVEIRDNKVFRVSKDITQLNKIDGEFIGGSKISHQMYKRMLEDFKGNKNPYISYEHVMLNVSEENPIGYCKIDDLVWCEIDKKEDYRNLKYVIYPKLKRKEAEVRAEFVKSTLSEALDIEKDIISNVERLGGLTNKNYKVKVNDEDFVVRLAGNGTSQIIDRLNEKINSKVAYKIGLDSECIYFNEHTGLKICRFIKDAETLNPTTGKKESNMELMANALKILHNSQERFSDDFNPFDGTEFYEKALIDANGKVFDDYYELKKLFMPLRNELETLGMMYTSCHLDTLPENFIKSGEDKIYLIDWEYSGNYDFLYDLAAVSLECGYTEDEEALLLKKYFGREATSVENKKMRIHQIMQFMFWAMWAATKVAKGDEYLYDFAFDRYNRGREALKQYLQKNAC